MTNGCHWQVKAAGKIDFHKGVHPTSAGPGGGPTARAIPDVRSNERYRLRIPKTRHALVLSLALVAGSLGIAAPAGAADAAPNCINLLPSTPGLTADIDGDGYPDAQVSSYRDVTLCAQGDVELYDSRPILDTEVCGEWFNCMAFRVTVDFRGAVDAGLTLCYSVDWWRSCWGPDPGPVPVGAGLRTICVGYDQYGGHPCSGQMFSFE